MATNRRVVKKEGADFYPTPSWGTKVLAHHELFYGTILEPACGNGAMSEVLKEMYGTDVISSDLYDRGYGTPNIDFLETDIYSGGVIDNVVTNPPFNIAEQFLEKSLQITSKKVCMLLRLAFVESAGRYKRVFNINPPSRVWVFSERLTMYPEGERTGGGGTTAYGWFVWDKNASNRTTEMKWFPTGYKE